MEAHRAPGKPLPPQDLDAERSVLGGVLLDNEKLDDVADIIVAADFYRPTHQVVYAAMLAMAEKNEPIDLVTLSAWLERSGKLGDAGGEDYIASLDANVPATANLSRYANIVRALSVKRRLLAAGQRIIRLAQGPGSADDILDAAEGEVLAVAEQGASSGNIETIGRLIKPVFDEIERDHDNPAAVTGLRTGFAGLDFATTGFHGGELIIIAGRPGQGKTGFAMNIAANVSVNGPSDGLRTSAVFSLEMTERKLIKRLFGSGAEVNGQRIRSGRLLDSDWPKLARAADRLFDAKLVIDDRSALTVMQLRTSCRRMRRRYPDLALIVVDYLQLMTGSGRAGQREQEVADISHGLKGIAKDLDLPVLALAQLNRSNERREDKRPTLSDIRESGAIEQDADLIIAMHRPELYSKKPEDKGTAEACVLKQRDGPTGTIRLAFRAEWTRFDDIEQTEATRENPWG